MDYLTLRIIWWALLGVLLSGFAILDGFDFGIAAIAPWVARTDLERRITYSTVAPVWEGNQVWFILGGGAIFAAWPMVYAVSFSGFYIAMFIVLLTFIVRPVAFKYRNKLPNATWRNSWDYALAAAALIGAIVLGVAVGNVLQGVPFHFDDNLRVFYTGTFWGLLNPFAILCGLLSLSLFVMQGAVYLANKTDANIRTRCLHLLKFATALVIGLFVVGGLWLTKLKGYVINSTIDMNGPSNPLHKIVAPQAGAWLQNYQHYPWCSLFPVLGILGALMALLIVRRCPKIAMICSSVSVAGIISTVGLSMFPFILPSSTHPNMSLLVWDASSSRTTLGIMTFATAVFMPIILIYTTWVYRVMRGVITEQNFDATY